MNMLAEAHLKVPQYRPIVPLKPVSAPVAAAAPAPLLPTIPVQPAVVTVGIQAPVILRGNGTSASDPIDVLDSDDELFEELNLTPVQEERVRRQFRRIRSEIS